MSSLTVAPTDARRRSLPVRSEIRVLVGDRTVQSLECPAGRHDGAFLNLPVHITYAVRVVADKFQAAALFVPVDKDEESTSIMCLVEPASVQPQFPAFSGLPADLQRTLNASPALDRTLSGRPVATRTADQRLLETRSFDERSLTEFGMEDGRLGSARWDGLDSEQKAGLLNLYAKMSSVTLGEETVWSHVETIDDVQRDRIHVHVDTALRRRITSETCFAGAGGLLHAPPVGYQREKSFKTGEPFGNLQLTFFTANGETTPTFVDADVDDAAGVEHGEQVVRNTVRGFLRKILGDSVPEGKTHPYDIHQLLIHYQTGVDGCRNIAQYQPLYLLKLRDGSQPFAI